MGLSFSSLFTSLSSLVRWSKDQDVRILMLGLDAAGKVHFVPALQSRISQPLPDYDIVPLTGIVHHVYLQPGR